MNFSRKVWSLTTSLLAATLVPTLVPSLVAADSITQNLASQPVSATALLQSTMTRYAALNTFRAHATWKREGQTSTRTETHTLVYAKPNKFRVVVANLDTTIFTISDGKQMLQYVISPRPYIIQKPAPLSIATSGAMHLKHFMYGDSPLLQFFDGPAAQSRLVAANSAVTAKPDAVVGKVPCRVIGFTAIGSFGNTEIAIGKADGLVHRITYDLAPFHPDEPNSVKITETYDVLQPNAKVTKTDFSTMLPKGIREKAEAANKPAPPIKEEARKEPGPPVPLGQTAPDFSIASIGATPPVKLSDYRGQVVLLDFWATWCPPCRKSLPETQRLNATYGNRGLKVFAISDEKPSTINPFVAQNKYTFPVYVDSKNDAGAAYGVVAIPTFAIIDKEGKLSAFFVGLQEDGIIEASLKKAGLEG